MRPYGSPHQGRSLSSPRAAHNQSISNKQSPFFLSTLSATVQVSVGQSRVGAAQRKAAGLNPSILKMRKFNSFQTVNNARVLWDHLAKPSGLLGGHLNIHSLVPKSDQIKHILIDSNLDYLCLSETWLNKNSPSSAIHIPGYNAFSCGQGWGLTVLYQRPHIM